MANFGSAPQATGVTFAQDFTLKSLTILSPNYGAYELMPIMTEMDYFEDIFSNVVTGRVMVSDAEGFVEKFNLNGNEYLRMTFGKAGGKQFDVDKIFRVYKMSARSLVSNMQTEAYILHFCSEELVLSEQYKVSKSYKDMKISEIITDICGENYLEVPKNKKLDIEETDGIYNFIVPNFKPFEAINWLSTYAKSKTEGVIGADMLFFENKDGYKFASLQTLFNQNIYRTYSYEPKNVDGKNQSQNEKFYSVLTYEFINSFDTLDAINSGIFANQLITFDPLLQKHSTVDFNYKDYFEKSKSLNKFPVVNNAKNRKGDTIYETPQAVIKMATSNSGQKDVSYIGGKPGSYSHNIFIEEYVPNRTAQISLTNYNKMKLVIDGDPGATVGSTINFNLLSTNPKTNGKEPDKFYSGKYLITAVRHSINITSFKTVLEIVKDSAPNQYVTPKDESTLWKNSVKGII
jgi:hypothetical protein